MHWLATAKVHQGDLPPLEQRRMPMTPGSLKRDKETQTSPRPGFSKEGVPRGLFGGMPRRMLKSERRCCWL